MHIIAENHRPSPAAQLPSILIVDDHPEVTRALTKLFAASGFRPIPFNNATDALNFVESTKPDAAIIDIHLPDLSGLVLSQRLRAKLGDSMPIIVLSGDNSMETINSLTHVGATYYFSKPVNPPLLLERVKELLPSNPR